MCGSARAIGRRSPAALALPLRLAAVHPAEQRYTLYNTPLLALYNRLYNTPLLAAVHPAEQRVQAAARRLQQGR